MNSLNSFEKSMKKHFNLNSKTPLFEKSSLEKNEELLTFATLFGDISGATIYDVIEDNLI